MIDELSMIPMGTTTRENEKDERLRHTHAHTVKHGIDALHTNTKKMPYAKEEEQRRRRERRRDILVSKRLSVRHSTAVSTVSPAAATSATAAVTAASSNALQVAPGQCPFLHAFTAATNARERVNPSTCPIVKTESLKDESLSLSSAQLAGLSPAERRRVKNRLSAMKSRDKVNGRLSLLEESLARVKDRERQLDLLMLALTHSETHRGTSSLPSPQTTFTPPTAVPVPMTTAEYVPVLTEADIATIMTDVDLDLTDFDVAFGNPVPPAHTVPTAVPSNVCFTHDVASVPCIEMSGRESDCDEDSVSLSSTTSSSNSSSSTLSVEDNEEMMLFSEELMQDLDVAMHMCYQYYPQSHAIMMGNGVAGCPFSAAVPVMPPMEVSQ